MTKQMAIWRSICIHCGHPKHDDHCFAPMCFNGKGVLSLPWTLGQLHNDKLIQYSPA
jgi:hypothetical protein